MMRLRGKKNDLFSTELEYLFKKLKMETRRGRVRLILVLNPRSTQAKNAEVEILEPLKQYIFQKKELKQISVLKYAVLPTNIDDNARRLAKLIQDRDVVVTIGGDGTASIGVNAVVLSKKMVKYYTFPYGNFNDIANVVKKAQGRKVFVIEAILNGEHFRYSLSYFTIGMLAESTRIFDERKVRKRLKKRRKNLFFSLWELVKWYFKNRKRDFLPEFFYQFDEQASLLKIKERISDVIILNGQTMAKIIRGGKYYTTEKRFLVGMKELRGFLDIGWFMFRGIFMGISGREARELEMRFDEKEQRSVEIQSEGEYRKIEKIRKIEFKKIKDPLQIL